MARSAKAIVKSLLQAEPVQRLGCLKGEMNDVKAHPFFFNVDWKALAQQKVSAPYKPTIKYAVCGCI